MLDTMCSKEDIKDLMLFPTLQNSNKVCFFTLGATCTTVDKNVCSTLGATYESIVIKHSSL